MNILVPDLWLRKYLHTKATPEQLKEYLSLCGPSIERIYGSGADTVYDIEITGNRPDSMSVIGVAREAATILPRFGIEANIVGDPYKQKQLLLKIPKSRLPLTIKTDSTLNPRWTSVVFDSISIKPSPEWLTKWLTLAGVRSINNVIDITNFLMLSYGQPAHVFDYDRIVGHTMILRASKKGERVTTLDGKTHTLSGDDIVMTDGSRKLIDLCGIMGGQSSAIHDTTRRVVLFLQTYDPIHIRRTSMSLAHRTQAASLFEKGTDTELVMPVFLEGVTLIQSVVRGTIASAITDIYPTPYKPYSVTTNRMKVDTYVGTKLSDAEISKYIKALGLSPKISKTEIKVSVPSFRRDIEQDVDIIEEIARIYGYHHIISRLPDREPPLVIPDATLNWEKEIKIRLRDWGYTELYTYSMISEKLMSLFELDKTRVYKISNPLSEDWVYMRPQLAPSVLLAIKQNINFQKNLKLFELSMTYTYRPNDVPLERSTLCVALTGNHFLEAKGLAEALFSHFGIPFPEEKSQKEKCLLLGDFGSVSEIHQSILDKLEIHTPVTIVTLYIDSMVTRANPTHTYQPVSMFPPAVEDLAFIVPEKFEVGPLIHALKQVDSMISNVSLLDVHKNTRTLHVTYQDPTRNLTSADIQPIREKLIATARKKFEATLKIN